MHLSNESLHRILSVPVVDTVGVVSYQLQDLWISPAKYSDSLSSAQLLDLLNSGTFTRAEQILLCDPTIAPLVDSLEKLNQTAMADYDPGSFSLATAGGLAKIFKTTTEQGQPIVGKSYQSLDYTYFPIEVSKVAFSKLTQWKNGFIVKRRVEYKTPEDRVGIDLSDPAMQTAWNNYATVASYNYETSEVWYPDYEALYNNMSLAPVGFDEAPSDSTTQDLSFSFLPQISANELTTYQISKTSSEPYLSQISNINRYLPIELKTTSQIFTNTQQQAELITGEIASLYPIGNTQQSEATALYLRELTYNNLAGINWPNQVRDFDQVALRQGRLIDFNCIPIAPLELGKDYAVLTTSPDIGLQSYGDLPALGWRPHPSDDSKLFALCRLRSPDNPSPPTVTFEDTGFPTGANNRMEIDWLISTSNIEASALRSLVYDTGSELFATYADKKLYYTHTDASGNMAFEIGQGSTYFGKLTQGAIGGYMGPTQSSVKYKSRYFGDTVKNSSIKNLFPISTSKLDCIKRTARNNIVLNRGFYTALQSVPPLTPPLGAYYSADGFLYWGQIPNQTPPVPAFFALIDAYNSTSISLSISLSLNWGPASEDRFYSIISTNGSITDITQQTTGSVVYENEIPGPTYKRDAPTVEINDYAAKESVAEAVKSWADDFYLGEANYNPIGKYRWIDENGTVMLEKDLYGHNDVYESFNIDVCLRLT